MKRKMIFAAIAVIATVSGIAGFNIHNQESKLNALTLANVEALSNDENSSNWQFSDGLSHTYECGAELSESWWGTRTCSFTVESCKGGGSGCNSRPCPQHG
ncbi:NVEALA domain-containing protein [Duncaniella muris]|uniref:NVEALA domain-containing protein n=1 Tax=Duncaniella muris TaxID=2094150 RepID=UPI0025A1C47D|nr:NVEALA domain-containing protein [Duncaniella muris]